MWKKIGNYYLDSQQQQIVLNKSKYLLVVAGAGSGKTLTILGKIGYLIEEKKVDINEILCISFTKKASDSLRQKIEKEFSFKVPVYTFHKLALKILEKCSYEIAGDDTLDNCINQFFNETIILDNNQLVYFFNYFNVRIKNKLNIKNQYLKFYKNNRKKISILEKNISTFLHLFKCNNYNLYDYNLFLKKIKKTLSYNKYKKEKSFLILTLNIYLIYQKYLEDNNEIDFDDMLIKATEYIKINGIENKYKYIIIDEYQDTSIIRFNLVKEILDKTNASLMVVGDDFQSIYKFTGCELSLFLNFKSYFKDAKIMKIENTYRNSQQLIKIAGDFVMKNKKQIHKDLHSNKYLSNPIKIVYYKDIKLTLKKLLINIYNDTNKPILILGRNNSDINGVLDNDFTINNEGIITYKKNTNIKMYYLTIHKSKGLEEENVVIINLINNCLGFPSQVCENKIFRLVSNSDDKYPFSEERRLFYVALTRTKNYVYLLVPTNNKSIFVSELIKDNYKKISIIRI